MDKQKSTNAPITGQDDVCEVLLVVPGYGDVGTLNPLSYPRDSSRTVMFAGGLPTLDTPVSNLHIRAFWVDEKEYRDLVEEGLIGPLEAKSSMGDLFRIVAHNTEKGAKIQTHLNKLRTSAGSLNGGSHVY